MELKQSESERSRQLLAKEQESKILKKELRDDRLQHRREFEDQEQKDCDDRLQHRREFEDQEQKHTKDARAMKSALDLAEATKEQCEKETEAAWVACHDQKLAHQTEMDELKIRYRE